MNRQRPSFPSALRRSDSSGANAPKRRQITAAAEVAFFTADQFRRYCHAKDQWPEPIPRVGKNPEERE